MKNLKLRTKFAMLIALSLLGIIASIALSLTELRDTMLEDRKLKTRHVVEVAQGIVASYQALEALGTLSREDAQTAAKLAVASLRYGGDEYFFITPWRASP